MCTQRRGHSGRSTFTLGKAGEGEKASGCAGLNGMVAFLLVAGGM
jgi:hypothetical protein